MDNNKLNIHPRANNSCGITYSNTEIIIMAYDGKIYINIPKELNVSLLGNDIVICADIKE